MLSGPGSAHSASPLAEETPFLCTDAQRKRSQVKRTKKRKPFAPTIRKAAVILPQKAVAKLERIPCGSCRSSMMNNLNYSDSFLISLTTSIAIL